MPRFNTLVLAGLLIALSGAHPLPAQTTSVSHLAVQSGNGQVVCICVTATLQAFQPISVKATDSNGNPVVGATITWQVTQTNGNLLLGSATTTTGGDGTSSNTLSQVVLNNFSTSSVPYLVGTIQATSNNTSVIFTETQSLVDQSTPASEISADPPTFNGANLSEATLTANVGTTLSTPIRIKVGGLGQASNGVPNVAIRLLNAQSSPSISCASQGGYADPGTVLTNAQGIATCFPVFAGSGPGTFFVLIGGEAGSDINSALYLQSYPSNPGSNAAGYNFTSVAGSPASVQIVSGNNQIGNVGQILNPLVAKVVDAGGNPVQGQNMVWTVAPLGAVSLTNNLTVTDNNGLVSTTVQLDILASAGVQVKVALASNSNISATFQLTLAGAITALNKISGDNQTAQVNTTFQQPLVVQVLNGNGPVANYPVQFQTNGPVTLVSTNNGIVGTDASGNASVTVKAGALAGTATVTAVVGILNKTFSLTITTQPVTPPPTSLAIIGATTGSAVINTAFAPLTVQVNNSSGPDPNIPVTFTTTGPVTIPTGTVNTNNSGQAQIIVTAGGTPGTATLTASIAGFTQTFNLTVLPPGPNISASSFLNAASRQVDFISPCSLATISAAGLTPDGITDLAPAPIFGRLPLSVHNLSVSFSGNIAPIVNVTMGSKNPEVTVQVPCEVTPGNNVSATVNVGPSNATTNIAVQVVSPGIFQTAMSDGVSRAVVVRDDGSFADVGTQFTNPARRGENVRLYVTGLGPTIPSVGTNSVQNPNADLFGRDALVAGKVQAAIVGYSGGITVVSARQAPDLIGVYEVQVLLPVDAPTGNNVQITVGIVPQGSSSSTPAISSLPALIPIQ